MAVMAKWNDHKFEVSPSVIRSFTALSFKGASETEEKTGSGQKYVSRKNGKPLEINLTAVLDRRLGNDVRKEATTWTEEARTGKTGYFYVHEKNSYYKLVPCKMMLVEAAASEVEMTPTGRWVRANVQLTLKQCACGDGSSGNSGSSGGGSGGGGSGGGYSKVSVKSTTPARTYRTSNGTLASRVFAKSTTPAAKVTSANKAIKQCTTAAKKATTTSKSLNLTGKTTVRRPVTVQRY